MARLIFVVDDNGHERINMILGEDREIKGFRNPAHALEALQTERQNIVFLNYRMPGRSGLYFLDR